MTPQVIRNAGAGALLALALMAAARAEDPQVAAKPAAHPFAALVGSWAGGGTISLTNDIQERLRCRATHSLSESNSLAISIRCASDNYRFELSSNVVERHGQISGRWSEAGSGNSGTIAGRIAGNRISAQASGDRFNAELILTTNGSRQSVTITPQATYITGVQIALGRR